LGNKGIVWNRAISDPASAGYSWADNREGANLYNADGFGRFIN